MTASPDSDERRTMPTVGDLLDAMRTYHSDSIHLQDCQQYARPESEAERAYIQGEIGRLSRDIVASRDRLLSMVGDHRADNALLAMSVRCEALKTVPADRVADLAIEQAKTDTKPVKFREFL